MARRPSLPSGRVTFAFVDVVGSTRAFHEHGHAYASAQRRLHSRIRHHTERSGGEVVSTEGDGAFLAFHHASAAAAALTALQAEVEADPDEGLHLRIRAGAHTGEAVPIDGNYLAVAVHVAARVSSAANAGQVLVTDAVVDELSGVHSPVEVGAFDLKDLPEPTRIWRVAGDSTPPRAIPARRTNVQPTRTSFVGRTEELSRLRELVSSPGPVTLVGPGGTGKTRLVSELALTDGGRSPGGVWLAELAALDSPDQVLGAVAAALTTSAELDQVTEMLRLRGRCVVAIDNCEHLLDAVAALTESLLDRCPDLTVLCTSREALDIPGERVWALPPLPVDGATQLFLERASELTVEPSQLDLVSSLCAALDGLPLAVELAAGQARGAPLAELLSAVTAGTEALERRGGDPRQRSLDAVLQWSLDRLSSGVRTSLLALSVFPGRFSAEMARPVLAATPGADLQALRVLTRGSLIDLDGSDYRLLWTIRDAARRQLEQDPDLRRGAQKGLAVWAASFGEERFDVLNKHEDLADDTLLAIETALDHALDLDVRGLGSAWHLLAVTTGARGARASTHALARRALGVAPTDRDSVYVISAGVHILESHYEDCQLSTETFRTMATIAEEADDGRLLATVLYGLAVHEGNLERWESTVSVLHEALAVTQRWPDARGDAPTIVAALGLAHSHVGDEARSAEYNLLALESGAEHGRWDIVAIAQVYLAERALVEARWAEARDHALAVLRTTPPNYRYRGSALGTLARALNRLGDTESAVAAGQQALELLDSQHRDVESREERRMLLAELPELGRP